jgi:hypothetical protein
VDNRSKGRRKNGIRKWEHRKTGKGKIIKNQKPNIHKSGRWEMGDCTTMKNHGGKWENQGMAKQDKTGDKRDSTTVENRRIRKWENWTTGQQERQECRKKLGEIWE